LHFSILNLQSTLSLPMLRFRTTVALFSIALAAPASAGDWPQILGPARNGVAVDEEVRRDWAGASPKTLWEREVGQGYAGVAVAGGRVYLFHRLADDEVVESLDAATGDVAWTARWPARYRGGIDPDLGPRCVPLVHGDALFLHGVAGRVACLNLADGNERWARDTRADFRFNEGFFGAGSTPIAMGDKLLVNVGGRDGSGIVAFSLATGQTVWRATDEGASYSSPIAATLDGRPHALFITRQSFLAIEPESGQVRFQTPFGRLGSTVNGANPLLIDDVHVFLTASYGVGGRLVDISGSDVKAVWDAGDVISSQYPTPVAYQGAVYGIDGREDIGVASLRCIDPLTGRVHWSQDGFGMATPILAGDTLLWMKTSGELVLIEPTTEAYRELARLGLCDQTARALPALASGRLYVRDTRALKCFDLK
jgi:outer membrane protein assembly factor BamB